MSMIDVKSAKTLEELKRQTFINFHEIEKKLGIVGDNVIDYATSGSPGGSTGGGGYGDTFDKVFLKDANTWITRNNAGDLVFRDANSGEVTLAQIKVLLAILWTYGDALGIKMTNLAGTERMVGITEDADGLTIFYSNSEVE